MAVKSAYPPLNLTFFSHCGRVRLKKAGEPVTDIFISYSRADRDRIEKLAAVLEADNFNVWWDKNITGGVEFSKETEARLDEAKVVLVVWSKNSIHSNWVADEATEGRERGCLVPIAIDEVKPKIGFRQFQTIAFENWNGEATSPEILELKAALTAQLTGSKPNFSSTIPENSHWVDQIRNPRFFALIGIVLTAALASVLWLPKSDREIQATEAGHTGNLNEAYKSIAVLAFSDLSPNRDQEYFSDGIAEELLNVLARQTNLRVAARTSSFAFKGSNEDIAAIGQALNVDAVLEGSVRKAGEKVRITAQLIDARSGFHLWSNTYDRVFDDVFAIQDEIAGSIVEALPSSKSDSDLSAVIQTDNEAYDLFLQGRHYLALRTRGSIEKALALFQRVVEIDPDYAPAWAEIGIAANLLSRGPDTYGDWTLNQVTEIAGPAIEKSLSLDPLLAEAHTAKGLFLARQRKSEEAIVEYRKAIALNPSTPNARHLLYLTLTFVGEFSEAHDVIDEAAEFDPLSAIILENRVSSLVLRDQTDEAFEVARQLSNLHPGWPLSISALAAPYSATGRFAEAAKLIETAANLSQSDNAYANASFALINIKMWDHPLVEKAPVDPASFLAVNEGRYEEARTLVMRQFNNNPGNTFAAWRAGWTLWAIGEAEEALDLFERSIDPFEGLEAIDVTSPLGCYPGIYIAGLRQRLGDPSAAEPIIRECNEIIANMEAQGYVLPFYERDMPIELLMLEGKHEEALMALRKLADSGQFISWWIEVEPIYEPVRNDPRFKQIVLDLKLLAERERQRFLALDNIPQ